MALCATCRGVKFRPLLLACLEQCRNRQEANGEDYDTPKNSPRVEHHDDIFEIEKSSGDCNLCAVIFQAFAKKNLTDVEMARGLPIIFRAFRNKIEVCLDVEGQLTKLCDLDMYTNRVQVDELFQTCKIKQDSSLPILKMLEKDPGSKESLAIARSWLRDCSNNHDTCKPPAQLQKMPKRLIDVGNEDQNPFLVETSPDSQLVEWSSLSYCWGEGVEPSMSLTKDNMDILINGVPLDKLDATVRDAILVTRALEIKYIWIDALCIMQDNNDPKDWNEQAPKMHEIYGGSTVTLVVDSSNSVKNGFLKEREFQYIRISSSGHQLTESTRTGSPAGAFLSAGWNEDEDEANGPWSNRGWTMQEGLLPNRLLYYTTSQMIWKCCKERKFERGVTKSVEGVIAKTLTYSDDISFGSQWFWELETFTKFKTLRSYLPDSLGDDFPGQSEAFRLWYDLIEIYTQRRFHHISDRFAAISSLAKIYGTTIRSDEYVAGLWKPDLIRGLTWYTEGAKLIPQQSADRTQAIAIFPSWSWASVGYEVVKNRQKDNQGDFRQVSRVDSVVIDLVDSREPFSALKSGHATITGPLKKIPRLYNKEWKSAEVPMSEFERHISKVVEEESPEGVESRYSSPTGRHFAALQMLEDFCSLDLIVLEDTGEIRKGIYEYRRVGVLTLFHMSPGTATSPDVIAEIKDCEISLAAQLNPRQKQEVQKASNAAIAELKEEPWDEETVIIV